MESQDLDRHKRTEDDEPDVEAHRHKSRHKLTEDTESDEPDVEAHRFQRSDDGAPDPDAHRLGGRG